MLLALLSLLLQTPAVAPQALRFGTWFGYAVCGLDDLDGDCVREWAVGCPAAGRGDEHGRVLVFSGRTREVIRDLWLGIPNGALGFQMSSPADFDGDGLSDIAVSAWCYRDRIDGVVLIASPVTGRLLHRIDAFGDWLGSVDGASRFALRKGDRFPYSYDLVDVTASEVLVRRADFALGKIRALADFDGDGVLDFAFQHASDAMPGSILSGRSGDRFLDLERDPKLPSWTSCPPERGCERALVVGDRWWDDDSGRVVVYDAATGRALYQRTPSERLGSSHPKYEFGYSVSRLPDVDGDGIEDIAVGAPGCEEGSSYVMAFSAARGTWLWEHEGGFLSHVGVSMTLIDDVDGDTRRDLLVGESEYIPDGAADELGSVRALSSKTGKLLFKIEEQELKL